MEFVTRKLNAGDAFAFARIVKAAKIKEQLAGIAKESTKGKSKQEVAELIESKGVEVLFAIIEGAAEKSAEAGIYEFLGKISGKKPQEIESLEIEDFINLVKQIVAENDIASFFTYVRRLMK